MAMKNDFEATSDIHSPFVDEVANQGVPGISNEEVERQAVASNRLFLAKEAASDKNIRKLAQAQSKPTVTAFTGDTRSVGKKVKQNRTAQQEALDAALGR